MKYGNITYTGTNQLIGERLKKIVEEAKRNDYLLKLGKATELAFKHKKMLFLDNPKGFGTGQSTAELLEWAEKEGTP